MQLISRGQAGDHEAFAALFEQYKNLVYRTAYLMLGDASEAEDALQEVFVRVYKSLPGFDARKGAFTTWLHRVTINYCLSHQRKRQPTYLPVEEVLLSLLDESPTASLAERQVIREAVGDLSEKQRAVVILRYFWDLSYAEIADVLDIPLGTVRSRLDLALKTLRGMLTDREEDPISDHLPEMEVR